MPRAKSDRVEVPNGQDPEANGGLDTTLEAGDEAISVEGERGGGIDAGTGTDTGNLGAGVARDGSIGDEDDRIIRDEAGRPTYSPTGRLRKRRTRSAGGTREAVKPAKAKKVPVDALARVLMMGHLMMANLSGTPELEINENEGVMIATPLSELLVLYEVEIDPRILQLMELGGACSYVYGPRIYMIRQRLRAEKQAKAEAREREQHRSLVPVVETAPIFKPEVDPFAGPLGGRA